MTSKMIKREFMEELNTTLCKYITQPYTSVTVENMGRDIINIVRKYQANGYFVKGNIEVKLTVDPLSLKNVPVCKFYLNGKKVEYVDELLANIVKHDLQEKQLKHNLHLKGNLIENHKVLPMLDEREPMVCDICGCIIPLDKELKCEKCGLIRCSGCVDACKECGEPLCCNQAIFNSDICKECEERLYLDVIEERLER